MTVFDRPFLFLRHPNGGVEDLAAMKAAGFAGVFCNIGDHPPESWEYIVRPRALAQGMFCGPWAHTRQPDGRFAPGKLEQLVACSDRWDSPLIVNSEKEIDGSGDACTGMIAEEVGDRDAAISMEAWLFNPPSVDWAPVAHLPMLLQIFPQESQPAKDPYACKEHAHQCGIQKVFFTYGTYQGASPAWYDLTAAYSLYTADDCGGEYQQWRPTGAGYNPNAPSPPKPNGGTTTVTKGAATSADLVFEHWYNSSARPSDWRRDNPGEWAAIQQYREAAPGTPPPAGIVSHTGMMLLASIEARRWADGTHA